MKPAARLNANERILALQSMSKLNQKSSSLEDDELSGATGILKGLFLIASLYLIGILTLML